MASAEPRTCSIARTLDIVGEKWALLAIREVFLGDRGKLRSMVEELFDPSRRESAIGRISTMLESYFDGDDPAEREVRSLADRLFIAQIMMFFHQAVEQRLVGGAPHLLKLQRLEVPQAIRYGRGVQQHRCRARSFRQRIMPHVSHWRQRDLAGPLQHQEQATAHHFA